MTKDQFVRMVAKLKTTYEGEGEDATMVLDGVIGEARQIVQAESSR